MKRLLVIDDDNSHRLMVKAVTEDFGWEVIEASSGEEGVNIFRGLEQEQEKSNNIKSFKSEIKKSDFKHLSRAERHIDVVLVDMRMPGIDGRETLIRLHDIRPDVPVILFTAYGTVGAAVEAMKSGAFDYLTKPVDNDELLLTLQRAYEYGQLQLENESLKIALKAHEQNLIIGNSNAIKNVHDFIAQAGPSEVTVLIGGESGTGKELIAEGLHKASERSKMPIIKINCAALPGNLLESELFGYEKGAFTGAVKDKPGRFLLANGGTIFLDEIGELPLDLQAKLLRVIQEREIEPLGSIKSIPIDVRIIAATNRNLRNAVRSGDFREDLFFRLNVLEVVSPPLRERLEDIPLLVEHFIKKLSEKNRKPLRGVTSAFLEALLMYSWPGNVRELENIVERAIVLGRSDNLDIDVLPANIVQLENINSLGDRASLNSPVEDKKSYGTFDNKEQENLEESLLDIAEKQALLQSLHKNNGHRQKTADELGISRRALQYKLKKFNLIRN